MLRSGATSAMSGNRAVAPEISSTIEGLLRLRHFSSCAVQNCTERGGKRAWLPRRQLAPPARPRLARARALPTGPDGPSPFSEVGARASQEGERSRLGERETKAMHRHCTHSDANKG
jgi:hypothetical protein